MGVDIFSITPSVISRDLKGKYVLIYGKEKSGKTTAAASFPKALLCAFERGYNGLGGVMAQDINSWSDFKAVLRQLEKPEAKELYQTIIIDTVSIAWDQCEQFICRQNGVQKISDIAWGGGYSACKKEFETSLRKITMMGYGVVLIAHNASRIEKTADGSEIEIIYPDLPKRAAEICNGIVDIIGYIGTEWENGEAKRWLYTRETPTLFAGSRFKYMAPKIPFGYDELVKAIADAIELAEQKDGVKVVDTAELVSVKEQLNFNEVRAEAARLWNQLVGSGANANPEMANTILKKIEIIMGHRMKLSEFTEDQVEMLALVVDEMKDM